MNPPTVPEAAPGFVSAEEVAAVMEGLSTDDSVRLAQLARLRCLGALGLEWQDLLHEAFIRVLDGRRRWPRDVPFVAFMAQSMRSIASETRQADLVEFGALDEHEAGEEQGPAAVLAKTDITPEREMAGRQMLLEIEALFAEDAIGLAVLEAAARGDSAAEVQVRLGLDSTAYASTLRRIRRRLTGYLLP
ncbi:MAG: hypothetical protein E6Q92_05725, partial [Burkholderiaceae bacterium]